MHQLIKSLLDSGPVVTDGSWGTQMQKRGLKRGECPHFWRQPAGAQKIQA
jgi:hypothetical protein